MQASLHSLTATVRCHSSIVKPSNQTTTSDLLLQRVQLQADHPGVLQSQSHNASVIAW